MNQYSRRIMRMLSIMLTVFSNTYICVEGDIDMLHYDGGDAVYTITIYVYDKNKVVRRVKSVVEDALRPLGFTGKYVFSKYVGKNIYSVFVTQHS